MPPYFVLPSLPSSSGIVPAFSERSCGKSRTRREILPCPGREIKDRIPISRASILVRHGRDVGSRATSGQVRSRRREREKRKRSESDGGEARGATVTSIDPEPSVTPRNQCAKKEKGRVTSPISTRAKNSCPSFLSLRRSFRFRSSSDTISPAESSSLKSLEAA